MFEFLGQNNMFNFPDIKFLSNSNQIDSLFVSIEILWTSNFVSCIRITVKNT